jgi:hypothetical protein
MTPVKILERGGVPDSPRVSLAFLGGKVPERIAQARVPRHYNVVLSDIYPGSRHHSRHADVHV